MAYNPKLITPRNNELFDSWSLVHIATSAMLAILIDPLIALLIVFACEPIEIFVISPILGRFGILFGHETFRNVMSDLVVDAIGVGIGWAFVSLL